MQSICTRSIGLPSLHFEAVETGEVADLRCCGGAPVRDWENPRVGSPCIRHCSHRHYVGTYTVSTCAVSTDRRACPLAEKPVFSTVHLETSKSV